MLVIPGIGQVFLSGAGGVGLLHVPTRARRPYDKKKVTQKENVGDIPPPPDPDEEEERRRRRRRTQSSKTSPMERRQEREDKRRRRAMKLGPVVIQSVN